MTKVTLPARKDQPSARPNPMLAALQGRAETRASAPTAPSELDAASPSTALPPPVVPEKAKAATPSNAPQVIRRKAKASRVDRRYMGGYFPPSVHKAMHFVSIEEDRSIQELMEEAVHDFLVRKGQGKRIK